MVERGRENSRDCDAMRPFLTIGAIVALLMAGACAGYSYGSQLEFLFAEAAAQTKTDLSDAKAWFAKGQAALQSGDLDSAEQAFRKVLAADPTAGAAYASRGVIDMRRKHWDEEFKDLKKAEKLAPRMAGVRLNIGLVEFRLGNYAEAIAPLQSVLRDEPRSAQARYLLGMCLVFTDQFGEAAETLEPLWQERSGDVMYLYRLGIAAEKGGEKELEDPAMKRGVEVGECTPAVYLIMWKAY